MFATKICESVVYVGGVVNEQDLGDLADLDDVRVEEFAAVGEHE